MGTSPFISNSTVSIYLSIVSICLSAVCLFFCLSICLSICLFICLSVSICPSVCLSVFLSVYLSIRLSIHLSVYPSIYLSIHVSFSLFPYSPHSSSFTPRHAPLFVEQEHWHWVNGILYTSQTWNTKTRKLKGNLCIKMYTYCSVDLYCNILICREM